MDLSCGHCGHHGPLQHKENVVLRTDTVQLSDGPYDLNVHFAAVYLCLACDEPTLWYRSWSSEAEEWFGERRLYPRPRDNTGVPEKVGKRLDSALRVKQIDHDFFAAGIRRMLETVCNEEGAEGKDLFAKLDDLAAKQRIPDVLARVAHELRRLGNLGAHDEEVSVSPDDVPVIEDLADAILEYLYRAPAKLAAVQQGIERREGGGPTNRLG